MNIKKAFSNSLIKKKNNYFLGRDDNRNVYICNIMTIIVIKLRFLP